MASIQGAINSFLGQTALAAGYAYKMKQGELERSRARTDVAAKELQPDEQKQYAKIAAERATRPVGSIADIQTELGREEATRQDISERTEKYNRAVADARNARIIAARSFFDNFADDSDFETTRVKFNNQEIDFTTI